MIKHLYRDSFAIIRAARYSIVSVSLLYIGAIAIGWFYPEHFSFLEDQFREIAKDFIDKSALVFIIKIFLRNLVASYAVACIISLWGIIPACAAVANGLLLGLIASFMGEVAYTKLAFLLIPHGIFEWPAMFVAWGLGLWKGLGHRMNRVELGFMERVKKVNLAYFTIVFPLLVIAAVIEGRYHIIKELFG